MPADIPCHAGDVCRQKLCSHDCTAQYSTVQQRLQYRTVSLGLLLCPPLCAPPLELGLELFFVTLPGEWPLALGPFPCCALLGQSLAKCVFSPQRLQAPPCREGGGGKQRETDATSSVIVRAIAILTERRGEQPLPAPRQACQAQRCHVQKRKAGCSNENYTVTLEADTASCRLQAGVSQWYTLGYRPWGFSGQSRLRCPGWRHTKHTACCAPPAEGKPSCQHRAWWRNLRRLRQCWPYCTVLLRWGSVDNSSPQC